MRLKYANVTSDIIMIITQLLCAIKRSHYRPSGVLGRSDAAQTQTLMKHLSSSMKKTHQTRTGKIETFNENVYPPVALSGINR